MFEKVNPSHPDKIADRIAGAIVDLAYSIVDAPKIAVEVLIGHGSCHIIIESSCVLDEQLIKDAVFRIAGEMAEVSILQFAQDRHLANNQKELSCGDNGIFRGIPISREEKQLAEMVCNLYREFPSDGKFILDNDKLIICQSCVTSTDLEERFPNAIINPLGFWSGGTNVDTGATNRKLGSDMGRAVTGGGLHGKDLSKADVSINIYLHLKAQKTGAAQELSCAIGDKIVDGKPYAEIVKVAHDYIKTLGGFEKLAEYGLINSLHLQ